MTLSTLLSRSRLQKARHLAWVGWVVLAMVVIELTVAALHPSRGDQRSNFFEYRYGRAETPDRLITADKLAIFAEDEPVILQVGDSSGFHGVQPPVIEAKLGHRYLNMSVFGSQGYEGYLQTAKYMFERNQRIRYIVLYVTPAGQQPRPFTVQSGDLFGDDIAREYNSKIHSLFHLPSLALRARVTDLFYYGSVDPAEKASLRQPTRYMAAPDLIRQSGGWTREEDNGASSCAPRPDVTDCADVAESVVDWGRRVLRLQTFSNEAVVAAMGKDFGISPDVFDLSRLGYVNMADQVYDRFRTLAETHGAKLIIAGAPLSDVFRGGEVGAKIDAFTSRLHEYASRHPSVAIIDPVYWPDARFSSTVHISTPNTWANSVRFAEALASVVDISTPSHDALSRGRKRVDKILMSEQTPPGYGFGPATGLGGVVYRAIREGRSEALLYNRAPDGVKIVRMTIAPETPPEIRSSLSLAINGELAERLISTEPVTLLWRLPKAAHAYQGWMEILVSTRGKGSWASDGLESGATGPQAKIASLIFE